MEKYETQHGPNQITSLHKRWHIKIILKISLYMKSSNRAWVIQIESKVKQLVLH